MSQPGPERRSSPSERWSPLSELDQFAEGMRRMLEQAFGGAEWSSVLSEARTWAPPVDIEETDEGYVIEAELPGVKREDVNIELIGDELTVTGEIKERERKGVVRRRTRRVGQFELRVVLPDPVESEKIEASLDAGVLTVRAPKAERAARRKIEVKS
jgi:HSP20 family protein